MDPEALLSVCLGDRELLRKFLLLSQEHSRPRPAGVSLLESPHPLHLHGDFSWQVVFSGGDPINDELYPLLPSFPSPGSAFPLFSLLLTRSFSLTDLELGELKIFTGEVRVRSCSPNFISQYSSWGPQATVTTTVL